MTDVHRLPQEGVADTGSWNAVMTWPIDEGDFGCHLVATWGCGAGIVWPTIEGDRPLPMRPARRTRRALVEPPQSWSYQRTPGGGLVSVSWTPCLRTLELGTEHLHLLGRVYWVVWPTLPGTPSPGKAIVD